MMWVGLAILGIGIGVIFDGLAQGLRLRRVAADEVALSLAAERILGALASREAAPEAVEEGEEDGVSWRIEPRETPAEGAEGRVPGLVEIRLTLASPGGRSWELATLLPPPAKSGP